MVPVKAREETFAIEAMVARTRRLPTVETTALKIIQLCAEDSSPVPRLVPLVERDPALLAQVLGIANSSYFNYPGQVYSARAAADILGARLMKNVVLGIAFYSYYKGGRCLHGLNLKQFRDHAFLTGKIGEVLGQIYNPDLTAVLYVAGLLHDLGKLVEAQHLGEEFYFLLEKSRREGVRLDESERRCCGFHHGEVGSALLAKWNLPPVLAELVRAHHSPGVSGQNPAREQPQQLLYLSNILAHYLQNHWSGYEAVLQYDVDFPRYFSFTPSEFDELVTEVRRRLKPAFGASVVNSQTQALSP